MRLRRARPARPPGRRWWTGRDVGLAYSGIVAATALTLAVLPDGVHQRFVQRASTNLDNLAHHPLFSLVASVFVVSTAWSLYQLPFLVLAYGAAQRWVGRRATIAVAVLGHVGSTLIVAAVLHEAVVHGHEDPNIAHVIDVGVSYAGVCLGAFVVSRVPRLLRPAYALGLVGYFAGPVLTEHTFTSLGHTCSLVLGFGAARLVSRRRGRDTLAGSESESLEVGRD
ncbi:MAG TPA: rhomboid-like protein [Sporichthyaceae bacterium]|nr:rhomboid-like protein [Sporichthyaceae bacterium]